MPKKTKIPAPAGLPSGLAQPAVRALKSAGITNLQQIAKATEAELMELHGMGPNAMLKVKEALRQAGLSLAKPRKN
jgi:DNA-directed RNA polymerase alpha subunit